MAGLKLAAILPPFYNSNTSAICVISSGRTSSGISFVLIRGGFVMMHPAFSMDILIGLIWLRMYRVRMPFSVLVYYIILNGLCASAGFLRESSEYRKPPKTIRHWLVVVCRFDETANIAALIQDKVVWQPYFITVFGDFISRYVMPIWFYNGIGARHKQ